MFIDFDLPSMSLLWGKRSVARALTELANTLAPATVAGLVITR
jgi:hypothetical protein